MNARSAPNKDKATKTPPTNLPLHHDVSSDRFRLKESSSGSQSPEENPLIFRGSFSGNVNGKECIKPTLNETVSARTSRSQCWQTRRAIGEWQRGVTRSRKIDFCGSIQVDFTVFSIRLGWSCARWDSDTPADEGGAYGSVQEPFQFSGEGAAVHADLPSLGPTALIWWACEGAAQTSNIGGANRPPRLESSDWANGNALPLTVR